MDRKILAATHIHPAAQKFIVNNHQNIVNEVIATVEKNKIVVVGMDQNPVVKKAKKLLESHNLTYTELSYGNYLSHWKQRLAIKLWSGWPTFPQVFIEGKLIGGAAELAEFLKK